MYSFRFMGDRLMRRDKALPTSLFRLPKISSRFLVTPAISAVQLAGRHKVSPIAVTGPCSHQRLSISNFMGCRHALDGYR